MAPKPAQDQQRQPLADDILSTGPLRVRSKKRKAKRGLEDGEGFVDAKASRKILKIGQDLEEEETQERKQSEPSAAFAFDSRFVDEVPSDEGEEQDEEEAWGDEDEEIIEEVEADQSELDLFEKFLPPQSRGLPVTADDDTRQGNGDSVNLADLILQQIEAHEAKAGQGAYGNDFVPPEGAIELPIKVVEVYSKIGLILSRYKSGKLPKPFKVIPTMAQWEDLLAITRPDSWTPNACYEATKIFVSSNPYVVRRFLETVILERVREEIHETKKLNVHLYKALKKSIYKPAAFFKGFLFPLVSSGTCTLREAHILSSILVRVSIPVLHSAAALMRLTEIAAEQMSMSTEGGGATNIFIRVLLEKKYALPYKVIDNLVFHFLRFRNTDPQSGDESLNGFNDQNSKDLKLPVLWHQCLLIFAQRYRNDITEDQREALLDLLLTRGHRDIGPEVRKELLAGRGRGVPVPVDIHDDGDDTMLVDPI
ncbi:snoRNA-binding rRNA-processing protein [Agyrium rufum]|nr:snoRNA-binding rRNA-processing protein [Agyrium rufum]